jgi:hypothetical protein
MYIDEYDCRRKKKKKKKNKGNVLQFTERKRKKKSRNKSCTSKPTIKISIRIEEFTLLCTAFPSSFPTHPVSSFHSQFVMFTHISLTYTTSHEFLKSTQPRKLVELIHMHDNNIDSSAETPSHSDASRIESHDVKIGAHTPVEAFAM